MHKDISQYFEKQPNPQKAILQKIRSLISNEFPEAEEIMSYGVPAFKLHKKTIMYAAFKEHIGLYPTPEVIEAFHKELVNYETSKGAIKFSITQAVPYDLILKITKYRFK